MVSLRNISIVIAVLGLILAGVCFQSEQEWGFALLGIFVAVGMFLLFVMMRRRALSRMRDSCASADAPVEYLGWNGTFHHLVFSNQAYVG